MAIYAIIKNNKVVNKVEAEQEFAETVGWILSTESEIGDIYENGEFSKPEIIVPVPQQLTMRQARLALLNADKLADVTTAINSLPSPQKEAAQIEWEYSMTCERDWPLVAALGPLLGLSEEDLDDLFRLAITL